MDWLYWYTATVISVYDGDTVTVDIDCGMSTWIRGQKIRLYRINTPEIRGPERPQGLIARDWLREQILGKQVHINTFKDGTGKYGRLLADIWIGNRCLNDELVKQGMAEYREY